MKLVLIGLLLFPLQSFSAQKVLGVQYVRSFHAGVHQNKSRYSVVLTTISCGFPVKVLEVPKSLQLNFTKVKVGMHVGYIRSELLQDEQEKCFQDKYPRFVDHMDLDLESMHYFGRLYDLYVEGSSNAR